MKTVSIPFSDESSHSPVMLEEAVSYLNPRPGKTYIDATVGTGGHSRAILASGGKGTKVIGIDADCDSAQAARQRLEPFGDCVSIVNSNFAEIESAVLPSGVRKVDGIIADLGISSRQISDSGRGFSFRADEPLDMRIDTDLELTASDIVNKMSADEIAGILKQYGEERFAKKIASAIVRSRAKAPIATSRELALIVSSSIPARFRPPFPHPATRTFQALRIKVNDEIEKLGVFLEKAVPLLARGARMVVISFHSLEDRVVKRTFNFMSLECVCPPDFPQCGCGKKRSLKVLTRKPVRPTQREIETNPRARSSRMRVAEGV